MNLTDILLFVVILLLLLLFLSILVMSQNSRKRQHKLRKSGQPHPNVIPGQGRDQPAAETESNGHDLTGGTRVEEPAAALESGYRRVDPSQDLSSPQSQPGKKNGKPH